MADMRSAFKPTADRIHRNGRIFLWAIVSLFTVAIASWCLHLFYVFLAVWLVLARAIARHQKELSAEASEAKAP